MKFSVLMSVYRNDRPEWLRECLDSVFGQTLPADEIVMVIDGPIAPELKNVVDDFALLHKELLVLPLPENVGLGRALNHGLSCCSNEIIVRMDADDVSRPHRFIRLIETFETFPDVDAVSSWIDEFEGTSDNVVSTRKVPQFPYELIDFARNRCPLNHPASAFKKSSIMLAGGYQHLPLYEDYYLWVRMLKSGFKIYNIQESLLLMRTSADMYKRRGGWEYAKTSAQFQWRLKKMGLISMATAFKNSFIRGAVFLMPNQLRAWFYKHFLR